MNGDASHLVGSETVQGRALDLWLDDHQDAPLAVSRPVQPPRHQDAEDQNPIVAYDLPTNLLGEMPSAEEIQPSTTTRLPSNAPQQSFDENLHDLQILWGSMEANLSWGGPFPVDSGIPNELISLPEFDIPEPTRSGFSELPTGPNSGSRRSDSPYSDDDTSLCNDQLPPLQKDDHAALSLPDNPSQRPCGSSAEHPRVLSANYPWHISKDDYQAVVSHVANVRHILPESFSLPSKYVFCRYVEGFFTGSHEHLPFLHFPTVSVAYLSPHLTLAIIAMGAQYRFERARAVTFYRASKSLIDYHIRANLQGKFLGTPRGQNDDAKSAFSADIEVLQAQVILTTLGIWADPELLHDSLAMASQMSLYLRDSGLLLDDTPTHDGTWSSWVQLEGQRRTKFIAFMLSNVQTILYNTPPKILNSEITSLYLPWPEELWRASSSAEWKTLLQRWPSCPSFGDGYAQLFRSQSVHKHHFSLSSFGNLILVHAVFQQIYLAWESATCLSLSEEKGASLPHETLTRFHAALHRWQKSWQISSDPSITPSSPGGPLGFNATAIFRIACLRLHVNLGPHRSFGTWDSETIGYAFLNAPRPVQTPQIYHAVLQSIHALSIPVRLGVEYVAKTQALTWSTIHSLCNVECALFLCKWLETLATDPTDLRRDERRLLRIIRSVLREADLAPAADDSGDIGREELRLIGVILVRLLSNILKGTHVFEMMGIFAGALRIYADLLESNIDSSTQE